MRVIPMRVIPVRVALLGVAALTLLAASGCAGRSDQAPAREPQTTTIAISYDDLLNQNAVTREVTLSVGDTLQVSLGSNPSTGFQWESDMRISDETVLAQTGHEVIAPSNGRPGAAGNAVWVLQAVGPGTATVSTRYSRPWEGGEQGTWTFTAAVTVN